MAEFAGKRLAFDAWNILYQFLASIRQADGTPLMDAQGRVTSHLSGILSRTGAIVEAGIRPIFVFDGEPHPLKRETLADRAARKVKAQGEYDEALAAGDLEKARSKAQQTSRLTVPMVEETQRLLRGLGVPVLQAPGEGEAQASWLASQGLVDGVVSQDYDSLLFGAPVLVRSLGVGGRRKLPGKQVWVDAQPERIVLAETLAAAHLSREQLVDAAVLVGTDFNPGIKGIGAKTAISLVREAGTLDALLSRLRANPSGASGAAERRILEQFEGLADRDEVRRIFLQPAHTSEAPPAAPAMDAAAVRKLLVDEHGFAAERVESALARFSGARERKRQATLF